MDSLRIFAGNSNRLLAAEICRFLQVGLGEAEVAHFADGEISVRISAQAIPIALWPDG